MGQGRRNTNMQRAAQILFANILNFIVNRPQRMAQRRQQAFAFLRQRQFTRHANKQAKSDMHLQLADPMADRPLGQVHFMRGEGKTQMAGGHLKGLQQRKDALLFKPAAMR